MAAKDEYIHSEEFNVAGHRKKMNNEEVGEGGEVSSKHSKAVSESDHSSITWSLLDRRAQTTSLPPSSNSSLATNDPEAPKTPPIPNQDAESRGNNQEPAPPQKKKPLMLSVVTAAMEEHQAITKSESSLVSEDEDMDEDDDDNDDDSWSEDDEEDPILSLIRNNKKGGSKSSKTARSNKSKPSSTTSSSSKKKRNPNRFFEGLEGIETPTDAASSEWKEPNSAPRPPSLPTTPRELGNWMKTLASNQVNKILKRDDPKASPSGAPPLAKNRPQRKFNKQEDEYHSTDSTNLLGDDELAELAKMRQSNKGSFSLLLDLVYENRQFAFIFFTLVLAAFLYFYTNKRVEDDII
eukprot:scaffold627_cov125-Cylindrotheca_fusiformis.AAC.12